LSCHLRLAAGCRPGEDDLRILETRLPDKSIKRGGVGAGDAHATVRGGLAEVSLLKGTVNGMPVLHIKDGMRHRRVIPLLAVPDLVHRTRSICSRGRGIAALSGRDWPGVFFDAIDKHRHLLLGLVDIDQDLGTVPGRFAILRRAFDSMACLMLILMPLLSAIAIGVGLWALPSELIDMRPLMANPWAIVKDLLPMIIMFTVAMALLASVFYSYGRRVDDEADSELRSRAPVLGLTGAGIGLTTGICYLVWFTFNVFPLIPQTVGGGKPVIIQLIRSPEVLSDLSQLNARLMPKCELLAEDDHTYAVRWSGAEETILRLDRSHYAGYQVVLGRGNARQPAGDR